MPVVRGIEEENKKKRDMRARIDPEIIEKTIKESISKIRKHIKKEIENQNKQLHKDLNNSIVWHGRALEKEFKKRALRRKKQKITGITEIVEIAVKDPKITLKTQAPASQGILVKTIEIQGPRKAITEHTEIYNSLSNPESSFKIECIKHIQRYKQEIRKKIDKSIDLHSIIIKSELITLPLAKPSTTSTKPSTSKE